MGQRYESGTTNFDSFVMGTAAFGQIYGASNPKERISSDELGSMFELLRNYQVKTFDTAFSYGDAHDVLANQLTDKAFYHPRIVTKITFPKVDFPSDWLDQQISSALSLFSLSSIQGLLLHSVEDFERPLVWDSMRRVKDQGLVEKIGISAYSPKDLISSSYTGYFDLVQVPVNVLDKRWVSPEWNGFLEKHENIEFHARSAMLQGLLVSDISFWPENVKSEYALVHQFLSSITQTARRTILDLCVNYVKSVPWIEGVVLGAFSSSQLNELLNAFARPAFTTVEMNDIIQQIPNVIPQLVDPRYWQR